MLKDYEVFESELNTLVIDVVNNTTSYATLKECHQRAVAGVENFFLEEETIVDVHDLFRIIRDGIATRVLELVENEMADEGFGDFPWSTSGQALAARAGTNKRWSPIRTTMPIDEGT